MRELKLFIDGEWVPGASTREVRAPFDSSVVGIAHQADDALVERAIAAGKAAEAPMAALEAHARRAILHRIAAGIAGRAEELADTISAEAGKPLSAARGEVARSQDTFTFAAEEAGRLSEESVDLDAVSAGSGRFGIVRRFPAGLVAAISPFNFPLNLVAHKLGPAFAAGCPVVLKPASQTPLTALLLAEIVEEAGMPRGGLNVVPTDRHTADVLTTDPRFDVLSFTGSPEVGWGMKARAGKKRVVLELGGDAAVIVEKDADLDLAAARVAYGAFVYAGQVCISVQRVLVDKRVYADFRGRFLDATKQLAVGDPRDPATVVGPLIDEKNADRIVTWMAEAEAAGATRVCGGAREGNVITPAIFENAPPGIRLSCDEAFGPVCTLAPYEDLDEAIARVNSSAYGLQTGIFTDSVAAVWRAYEGLKVGGVIHNDVPTFRVDHMPYGGVKDSGFGREGIKYALEDYTERRLLALRPRP